MATNGKGLQYPLHDIGDYPMFVTFQPIKKVNDNLQKQTSDVAQKQKENQSTWDKTTENLGVLGSALDFIAGSRTGKKTLTKAKNPPNSLSVVKGDSIRLYMPAGIQFQDGMQYNNFALGALGEAARRGISAGASGIGDLLLDQTKDLGQGFISGLLNNINSDVTAAVASRRMSKAGFDKAAAATSSAYGVTVNPNTRAMFEGVAVRAFSFSFQLIAKSREEAEMIQDIVQYLREEMYPETLTFENIPVGYRYPAKWNIRFWDSQLASPIFNKLKPAYLSSMSTVYNSAESTFHADGKPTSVEISLTFTEEVPLDKQNIKDGY